MKSVVLRRFEEIRDFQKSITSLAYELKAFDSKLHTSLFGKYYEQRLEKRDPVLTRENNQDVVIEEVYKNTKTIFGYGIATSYYILPQVMVLLSAERAVRMPTDAEIFGDPGENVVSNVGIRPEIGKNLNVGFRVGPYKISDSHKISFSGSGFWRNITDKIVRTSSTRSNDALQTLPNTNLGKAQSVGFEASLDYSYNNRLFLSANTSKFNSLFKTKYDPNGNIYPYYNKQIPNEPFYTINGNAQYRFKNLVQNNSDLNLYYSCGYVASFHTNWQHLEIDDTPSQFIQDLGLSYVFPKNQFIVSFDARNIFNKQAYDNYAVLKPGRGFYVKLNYTINKF
jgi:outer membrane receptor protein involved in Fe transport